MAIQLHHAHAWDLAPKAAIQVQHQLAGLVRAEPPPHPIKTIGGVDVSIKNNRARAAIVVIRLDDLSVVEETALEADIPFPYIPGLLSFREMPVILPALEQLTTWPDAFMTDSQGLAHPRRFGLACHLGVMLNWPAFGVAKTRFIGRSEPLGEAKGSTIPLIDKKEQIGNVVRTRAGVKPVYVSIGHQFTLEMATELTLRCSPKYKIPEPTRLAHNLSTKWK